MRLSNPEAFQKEIRRRAFERVDQLCREEKGIQQTQHTLDALQAVTGLSRSELETIAADVRTSFDAGAGDFFSIKDQVVMVSSALLLMGIFAWLIWLWLF